nr:stage II sporulation protein M [uncultured Oscillibacter sp.]
MNENIPRSPLSDLQAAWADGLKEEVRRSAIAFVTIWLLFFAACAFVPSLRTALADMMFSTLRGMNLSDAEGRISVLALFLNNLEAVAFIMLYGLLPFIQLPALALGVNAMMLGVMAAWYAAEGISPLAYLAALLPHGVLELPALFLAFGTGLYICGQLTRRCRKDQSARSVWACMSLASQVLLSVLVPLLLVAAFVEAYVTPAVAALFL